MRLLLLAATLALSMTGCQWLLPGAPPGTVTGVVLFDGQPAAGKRVTLSPDGKRTYTNGEGRYTFTNVGEGKHQVLYTSVADREGALPNEVATWRSEVFDLGGGYAVAPFDVSYNGLLYPDTAMSLIVSETSPVPFHFSPHRQGGKYRVVVRQFETKETAFEGGWSHDPTAIFAMAVPPGRYLWHVEIENGAGTGTTVARPVDF